MDAPEKAQLLADLEASRSALIAALSGVSEDLALRAPSPEKWSILQCVEHVAVVEENLLARVIAAQPSEAPPIDPRRETLIVARALDRTRPRQAPEAALPTGRFPTLSAALQHFLEGRDRTIRFVEQCTDDLRRRRTTHPVIGDVTCHEVLLLIAAHPLRHVQQIAEIKSAIS
jgi:uncharacterized damage-inducible protein DinB